MFLNVCFSHLTFAGLFCISFQSFRLLRCDQQYLGAYPDQCQHHASPRLVSLEMREIAQNFQSDAVRQISFQSFPSSGANPMNEIKSFIYY